MENQLERKTKDEMDIGLIQWLRIKEGLYRIITTTMVLDFLYSDGIGYFKESQTLNSKPYRFLVYLWYQVPPATLNVMVIIQALLQQVGELYAQGLGFRV